MLELVHAIGQFNAGRDPERLAMKYRLMRANAFVFLRGTCHLFYQRLPEHKLFTKAPPVWSCGDLHLENFGSYKGDNRQVYFDINDFDEAALAPLSWDVVRFLASVHTAAHSLQASHDQAQALCEAFVDAYFAALAQGKARWVERETATGLVGDLLAHLRERPRADWLDSRTELKGKRRRLRLDGRKALAATPAEHAHVAALVHTVAAQQDHPGFFEVLDVARRVAGTGSLGLPRFVVLVRGKGGPSGQYLLDLKAAQPSSLRKTLPTPQPSWPSQAHRIVALQQRLQAVPMAFLHPIEEGKAAYVLRALQPSEDRLALGARSARGQRLQAAIVQMGHCLAWAHLRSGGRQGSAVADELIAFGQAQRWRKSLLACAQQCATQTQRDWATYAQAFDDGAFQV